MHRFPVSLLCVPILLASLGAPAGWRSGWGLTGPTTSPPFAYVLPFDARRFSVGQAPRGRFSHHDAENRHAVDFTLPEGTPVLAARAGRVIAVEDRFSGNGLDPQRDRARANHVRIQHDDGSSALYGHLQRNGVRVRMGEQVQQGQLIALSGNTGYSTAPHLHFVVQVRRGNQFESVPAQIVSARGQLHFAAESEKGDGGD